MHPTFGWTDCEIAQAIQMIVVMKMNNLMAEACGHPYRLKATVRKKSVRA